MFQHLKIGLRKSSIFNRKSKIGNRKLSTFHNNFAFTLIELLVAISLSALIMLITAMIFKQASKTFSESDARNEVYQNVRAAFGILKRDISGAVLNADYELFEAFNDINPIDYPGINAKSGSDILRFLSSTPTRPDKPIALITYYLSNSNILYKAEDTGTNTLNASMDGFNPDTATNTHQLGFNVSTLQFRYRNTDETWGDTWIGTATQYLPDAVEVKMTISDMQNRYTGTSTSIISIR